MSVTRIASRYAKSLIDLAEEQGKLDRIKKDIDYFNAAVETRELYLLIKSPIVNSSKKKSIIDAIFGEHFDKLTLSFFHILLRKGREIYLPDIASSFISKYKEINEITTVKLTTAKPLSQENIQAIQSKLELSETTLKNIELDTQVDPEIIGGFIIEYEDRLYDASVQHQLETLKKEFADNKYITKL